MYEISRNNVSFKIHSVDEREKPCLWVKYNNHHYLVGQLKDKETVEMVKKVLDYVIFGSRGDEVMEMFENMEVI